MPVLPFSSETDVVPFAEAFVANHIERFNKDIAICLTPDQNNSHAYFPALMACIAFADLLSGLNAGKLEGQGLRHLKDYVSKFMDTAVYTNDRLSVLYECFRHKVAHLAQPYVVFDTKAKKKNNPFARQPRRLITWTVHDSGPVPPIEILPVNPPAQVLGAPIPWQVFYDHRAVVNIASLASDIVNSIPNYLKHLETDGAARRRFRACMPSYFPH